MYQSRLESNKDENIKTYSEYINKLASNIPESVIDLSQPRKRSRVPTQVFSEFLTNREQGDWAETLVTHTLSITLEDFVPVKYGKTDNIIAGEEGFKEFYIKYQDELDLIGKRPDTLIFPKESIQGLSSDLSGLSLEELSQIVPKALLGLEIRSSSFLSKRYEEAAKRGEINGGRKFLSFTPKIEDLLVVIKWISTYNVPHYYCQVFFDAVYAISFHKILEIINDTLNKNKLFYIETNEKNQQKRTIHLNINQGFHIGDIKDLPKHSSVAKELGRGRMLHHVKFEGGKLEVDEDGIRSLLLDAKKMKNGDFDCSYERLRIL